MQDFEVKNEFKRPTLLIFLTIVFSFLLSFAPKEMSIMGIEVKHVDIFSDLKPDPEEELLDQESSSEDGSSLIIDGKEKFINYASIPFINSAGDVISDFVSSEREKIDNYIASQSVRTGKSVITGNVNELKNFFNALKQTKSSKVRIAHFGDSVIEGDLVTADIRQNFQDKFGGKGVGFLSITSQDIQFRQTTKHRFSDNFESASVFTSNPKNLPLGIAGTVAIPNSNSWVSYETTRRYRTVKSFDEARIFYSDASGSVKVSINNGAPQSVRLKSGKGINESSVNVSTATSFKMEFESKGQGNFYGVSLEGGNGIYVDNFPLRGNSGVDLQQIDDASLREFGKLLNYKLIILEFGLNAAGSIKSDYGWYEREMVKVVNKFKKAFPNASILMISVHDKAKKTRSGFETDPTVLKLLEAQKNIAKQTNVAFWSLFDAMGGKNSMENWVNANPPLAFKDYVHFNGQGAQKVADLLTEALMDAYNKHR